MEIEPDVFLKMAADQSILGVDTESTGLRVQDQTDYLTGISIAFKGGPLYFSKYFPFRHNTGPNLDIRYAKEIGNLLNKKTLAIHGSKHDIAAFRTIGIELTTPICDPLIMAHMLEEELFSKQLDFLSKRFLGEGKYRDEIKAWTDLFGWSNVPSELMDAYAAKDAELHLRLYEYFMPRLQEEELDHLLPIEDEFTKLLARMEQRGVRVNTEFCKEQADYGEWRMLEIEDELGFCPSKPTQLNPFLLNDLKLPILKTSRKTGKPSFDAEVMRDYEEILALREDRSAKLVLEYRGWQKTVSTLYRKSLELVSLDGRIRPNFKQHGTKTTRNSCEKPNLQQIPREGKKAWNGRAKEAFIPAENFLLMEYDQRNLELRLGTEYANEKSLREAFSDSDRDVFNEMASRLGMERHATKTLTYTIQFGGGPPRIAHVFGVSEDKAKQIIDDFYNAYPGIKRSSNMATRLAKQRGYVRYWTGRRRHLHEFDARKAFNSLCQGGAAEIIKRQMLRVDKEILSEYGDDARMLLTVHDSFWIEMREGLEAELTPKILKIMADLPQFKTRFEASAKPVGGKI
jgi:DNA polymerase I